MPLNRSIGDSHYRESFLLNEVNFSLYYIIFLFCCLKIKERQTNRQTEDRKTDRQSDRQTDRDRDRDRQTDSQTNRDRQ